VEEKIREIISSEVSKYIPFVNQYFNKMHGYINHMRILYSVTNWDSLDHKKTVDYILLMKRYFSEMKKKMIEFSQKLVTLKRYDQDVERLHVAISSLNSELTLLLNNYLGRFDSYEKLDLIEGPAILEIKHKLSVDAPKLLNEKDGLLIRIDNGLARVNDMCILVNNKLRKKFYDLAPEQKDDKTKSKDERRKPAFFRF
jgi:hypothetical protein